MRYVLISPSRAVAQVVIRYGGRSPDVIDSDIPIHELSICKERNYPDGRQKSDRERCDDEPAHLAFRIVRRVDLVSDLIDQQRLFSRPRPGIFFSGHE